MDGRVGGWMYAWMTVGWMDVFIWIVCVCVCVDGLTDGQMDGSMMDGLVVECLFNRHILMFQGQSLTGNEVKRLLCDDNSPVAIDNLIQLSQGNLVSQIINKKVRKKEREKGRDRWNDREGVEKRDEIRKREE